MMRNICDSTVHEHASIPTTPAQYELSRGHIPVKRPVCCLTLLMGWLCSRDGLVRLDQAVTSQTYHHAMPRAMAMAVAPAQSHLQCS